MSPKAFLSLAFAAAVVVLCVQRASANDFYVRVQVLDCAMHPKAGAFVSLYGCTDRSDSSSPALQPQYSSAIYPVSTTLGGFAGTTIPTVADDPQMYCPYTDTTLGLKADYCSGSGNSNDCSLAVMKQLSTGEYVVDTDYAAKTNIFGQYLLDYVTNTLTSDGTAKLYPNVQCPSSNAYCSAPIYSFVPTTTSCPSTCAACPTGAGNPTTETIVAVSGETGYVYMCAGYSTDPNNPPSTSYPSFISFRSNQKKFASANSLVLKGNNWGWMAYWPITYISQDSGNTCFVSGFIYAGQDSPAGTAKAYVTSNGLIGPGSVFTLHFDLNATPNALSTVHVFFSCSSLTTNAPGQFGNTFSFSPAVSSYSGTATASNCAGSYLYMAIHVALA